MHQLIYTSHATFPFSDEDLLALLRWSRQWNEQVGITGVLLYGDGQFVQVVEGNVEAVDSLFEHIRRDVRHHDLIKLAYEPVAKRSFTQWSMGFHRATPEHMAQIKGYFDPQQLAQHSNELATRDELLFGLLQGFVQSSQSIW